MNEIIKLQEIKNSATVRENNIKTFYFIRMVTTVVLTLKK